MSPVAAIMLKRSEVPEYLRESERYQYLSCNNDEISVPAACVKTNTNIESVYDLEHLLLTVRHWGFKTVPKGVTTAALRSHQSWQISQADGETDELSFMGLIMAQRGQLECLKFLVQCGMQVDKALCIHAVTSAQLHCLKFLVEKYVEKRGVVDSDIWKAAINNGESSASCLIYLLKAFPDIKRKMDLVAWACRADRLKCLQVLRDHYCVVDVRAVLAAAEGGSLACLEYLHEEFGFRCWVPSLELTAPVNYDSGLGEKQLELMQMLQEISSAWDASALVTALCPQKKFQRTETPAMMATERVHAVVAPRE